jgi:hypothetical protein
VVTLRTCMRVVLGSNLKWDTNCSDGVFSCVFPQSLQVNPLMVSSVRRYPLPSTSFPVRNSLSSSHSTLYIVLAADRVGKYTTTYVDAHDFCNTSVDAQLILHSVTRRWGYS